MGNLIGDAAAWLAGQRHLHLTTPILWRHGGMEATVSATVGKVTFQITNSMGRVEEVTERTFVISASEFGGSSPEEGDELVEQTATGTITYSVMAPGGMPGVTLADAYGTSYKLFTKVIKQD